MPAKIRAKYQDGVLVPLEPLYYFGDGAEVSITVEKLVKAKKSADASKADAESVNNVKEEVDDEGPGIRMIRRLEEIWKDIPPEELDALPRDLAKNKKHYLYGHPKEED